MKRTTIFPAPNVQRQNVTMFFVSDILRRAVGSMTNDYSDRILTSSHDSADSSFPILSYGMMVSLPPEFDNKEPSIEVVTLFDSFDGSPSAVTMHDWDGERPTGMVSFVSNLSNNSIELMFSGDSESMSVHSKNILAASSLAAHELNHELGRVFTRAWRLSMSSEEERKMQSLVGLHLIEIEDGDEAAAAEYIAFAQAAQETFSVVVDFPSKGD